MPYFISDSAEGCDGWATVKDDGEVMGCHATKEDAIDQALAISQTEGSTFEGERSTRAAADELDEGDFVRWRSSGGTARGRIEHVMREGTLGVPDSSFSINAEPDNPAALIRIYRRVRDGWEETETLVGHRFSTLTKIDPLPEPSEDRDVDLTLPKVIRDAASQGLEYHREGKSGSGVVPRTIREASAMARGEISEDKVIRANAWAARHKVDLQASGARPGQDGYPTPGAVAHLLWGIPTGSGYDAATSWFARKAQQIKDDRSMGMTATPVKARNKGSGVEFRSTVVELRAEGDGNTFVGYAAMFNSPSQPLPFTERIAPGAFSKTLANRKRDVRLYVNHNSDLVLASKRSGTLTLSEDDRGLRVQAELPDTTYAADLRALMRAGVVDRMSFGFTVPRGGDKWSDDGRERELREIVLHEVSVVTGFPAYEQTQASVRTLNHLAERTGMDLDELNEVLDALAENDTVDPDKAARLIDAINAATPQPEPDPVANLIGLKQKQVDLLSKKP